MHNPTRIYFFVISLVTQLNPALELHSRGGIQLAPYRPIFLATHHITRTNSEKKPVVEHRQILGSSFTSFSRPLSGRMASGKHKVGKRKSTNLFPILQNSGLNFYTRLLLLFLLGALPCLALLLGMMGMSFPHLSYAFPHRHLFTAHRRQHAMLLAGTQPTHIKLDMLMETPFSCLLISSVSCEKGF